MDRAGLKTYSEWMAVFRAVRRGQQAAYYLASPDMTETRALFTFEQTEPHEDLSKTEGWTAIIPAEERPSLPRNRSTGPPKAMIKVDYRTDTKLVRVWVGPSRAAINQLKKSGYRYHAGDHRWAATREDIDAVVAGLKHEDRRVHLTLDGDDRGEQ